MENKKSYEICLFLQNCDMSMLCSSRYAGELTVDRSSLRELVPSAKSLFYVSQVLKQQQLIKSQVLLIILLALVEMILPIATHFSVAWSVVYCTHAFCFNHLTDSHAF